MDLNLSTIDERGEENPVAKMVLTVLALGAEMERKLILGRLNSGRALAKSKGVKLGRPQTTAEQIPQIFYRHYPSFKSGSLNLSEFARVCGLSRTTVYKY